MKVNYAYVSHISKCVQDRRELRHFKSSVLSTLFCVRVRRDDGETAVFVYVAGAQHCMF